ncbi:MAG: hypothetical protein H0W96_13810, partial [Solirubrobacterales bacterium]|nr:hypothetical protein [Solirubrobacterales bacterium]
LEAPDDDGAGVTHPGVPKIADPAALLRHLDASGHFHRDSRAGRMYHPGMVSLREAVSTDSLHVSVDDNRVMAHVDDASPLVVENEGRSRYSAPRAVAHNLAGMAKDLLTLVRGRQGDHRCELNCEWVAADAGGTPVKVPLLEPKTSAWGVQLDVRVAGSLDEARLEGALDDVVGVCGAGAECLTIVDCDDDGALDLARRRLHGTAVPLTSPPPFHVYLAHHPAGDMLMLNLNHAAVDGFGAARVLTRIARAYAADGNSQEALEFLACADLPVQPAPPATSRLVRLRRMTIERVRDALSRPPRLAAVEGGDRAGYGFHLVGLSAQQTRDMAAVGRADRGAALVAALHLAIADWNEARGMPGRRIGVLVPVDLRPDELAQHVMANLSVNSRLSSTPRERAKPAVTLRAIAWQAQRDNATRTGIALIAALQRAGMLALWAKQSSVVLQPLTDNHFADAAMLCDLGSLAEAPSFGSDAGPVRELWFSPPSRSPRCLCVGAVTVQGRLHVTFRYPHRLFGPEAVRRFADLYLAQLERVATCST